MLHQHSFALYFSFIRIILFCNGTLCFLNFEYINCFQAFHFATRSVEYMLKRTIMSTQKKTKPKNMTLLIIVFEGYENIIISYFLIIF